MEKTANAGNEKFAMASVDSKDRKETDKQAMIVEPPQAPITCSEIYTIALLLVINLVNFADRYTVPSVLVDIGKAYKIENQMILGLLQTVFVVTYMIFSPIFGYLGDRFNRRLLMAIGLFVWGSVSLGSYFVDPAWGDWSFWVFMALRAMIGTGEASYVTISPTIISDLFVGSRRTTILLIYQSTMLMGSGVGYMMASAVKSATGDFRYAFLVWPPVVFACMIGLIFMKEPERGKAEGATNLGHTSYLEDIKYLLKIKSYVHCTLAYTATVFVVGAISFWAPAFAEYQLRIQNPDADVGLVGFVFGFITILGGVIGAVGGTLTSRFMKKTKTFGETADAIACAVGALVSGPLIFFTLGVARFSTIGMWLMIFLSLTFLSVNLVLNQEITLYIMIPTRRASGAGMQILASHLLGDAISPYIVGALVDAFAASAKFSTDPPHEANNLEEFIFRQEALWLITIVCMLGALFYFWCSLHIIEDKDEAKSLAATLSRKSLANLAAAQQQQQGYEMSPPSANSAPPYSSATTSPEGAYNRAYFNIDSRVSSGYLSNSNIQIATTSSPPAMAVNAGYVASTVNISGNYPSDSTEF